MWKFQAVSDTVHVVVIKKFNPFAASDKKVFALHSISMSEKLAHITKRY